MLKGKFEEIDHRRVLELLKQGGLIIDVREQKSYAKEHIKGAINIPASEIDKKISEIPADKPVIVYCSSYSCTASLTAAKKLSELGRTNVYRFVGGLLEWKTAGLPTESSG
ncbi:MAG: rhodanese-like domain-containing protein [Desulfurococcales archaeon]|jgi:rhodanese-related sulfurtransferase|nr:rhodanese-like domain-containing protein [Desulfurococcales archaeon]